MNSVNPTAIKTGMGFHFHGQPRGDPIIARTPLGRFAGKHYELGRRSWVEGKRRPSGPLEGLAFRPLIKPLPERKFFSNRFIILYVNKGRYGIKRLLKGLCKKSVINGKALDANFCAEMSEVVGPVLFLLSDAASTISGVGLLVDGGYCAH